MRCEAQIARFWLCRLRVSQSVGIAVEIGVRKFAYLCIQVASCTGNSGYTDREESEDQNGRQKLA